MALTGIEERDKEKNGDNGRENKHEKDYHGGPNNYSDWADLANNIDRLLGGKGDVEDTDVFPMKQRFATFDY